MKLKVAMGLWVVASGCGTDSNPSHPRTSDDGPAVTPDSAADPTADVDGGASDTPGANTSSEADAGEVETGGPRGACGWGTFNDGLTGANVRDVLFDSRAPGIVYATTGSTVWRSTDSGSSWRQQGTLALGEVSRLSMDGSDPAKLLAASSSGLVRSTDAGKTWSFIALDGLSVSAVGVSTNAPQRIYVGTNGAGVLRSDNGGASFSDVGAAFPEGIALDFDVDPRNSNTVVAAVEGINESGGAASTSAFALSTNGGVSWTTTFSTPAFIAELARCPADPAVLIAATGQGIAHSADGGATWTMLPLDGSPNWATGVAFSPNSCLDFYALQATVGPRRSADGGHTFGAPLIDGLDLQRASSFPGKMTIDPADPTRLVLGTHGGVYVSADGGQAWEATVGMLELVAMALTGSPQDPGRLWLGTWGSGLWTRASTKDTWQRIPTSSLPMDHIMAAASDPYSPGDVWIGASYAWHGTGAEESPFEITTAGLNAQTFAFGPTDSDLLYVGTQVSGILKSTDGGKTFAASNGGLTPWPTTAGSVIDVRIVRVDSSAPKTVYAATNGSGLYKSVDGGSSWTKVYGGDEHVSCLQIVSGTPSTVYACGDGVRRSTDGGMTWQDLSSDLPTLEINGMVYDDRSRTMYVTSALGVYARRDDSAWEAIDVSCLPSARTPAIIEEAGQRSLVVAGTRGLFRRDL